MPTLIPRQPIRLRPEIAGGRTKTSDISVDPQTATLTVRLQRPTTAAPLDWPTTARIKVRLVLVVDGVEYAAVSHAVGGVRQDKRGEEATEYTLSYTPPWGFFGERTPQSRTRRIGETATQSVRAFCELEGNAETLLTLESAIAPAPDVSFHGSVAFGAASAAAESDAGGGGDGSVSVSHTAGGTDRAVFLAGCHGDNSSASSATYAGTSATQMWRLTRGAPLTNIGHRLAGDANVPTGAQTATVSFTAVDDYLTYIGVISMTGVHATTPVGTPATGGSATGNPSVTVASTTADGLVVDAMTTDYNSTITVGTNQTQRFAPTPAFEVDLRGSSQAGSAGGVMTWTFSGGSFEYAIGWDLGAVEFKAAAGGAAISVSETLSFAEALD